MDNASCSYYTFYIIQFKHRGFGEILDAIFRDDYSIFNANIKFFFRYPELRVKSDPHSPPYYRVNGVVPNVDAFYSTFDVKDGDAHFLGSEERVRIWR